MTNTFLHDPRDKCSRSEQIACLEQRVDYVTREFVSELQKTNKNLEFMSKEISILNYDRERIKGFVGGVVFLSTGMGVFLAYVFEHITGYKIIK